MIHQNYEDKEALIEMSRRKIQALLNYGFEIRANGELYDKANTIANRLENGETFTLTIPVGSCTCLKMSDMAFKLLKTYLKDILHIEQKARDSFIRRIINAKKHWIKWLNSIAYQVKLYKKEKELENHQSQD